jgi:hypothetical protein
LELVIVPDRAKAQHTWPRRSRSSLNPLLRGGFSCKLMVMDTIIWFCFLMSFITESFIQAILYFKSELFEFAYLSFLPHTFEKSIIVFSIWIICFLNFNPSILYIYFFLDFIPLMYLASFYLCGSAYVLEFKGQKCG